MTKASYRKPNDNYPLIIPVFIMNSGCPHRCVFCNQKISAGNFPEKITQEYFDRTVTSYLEWNKDKTRRVEIAFYGGSFTGIDSGDQEALLAMADAFIQRGLVHSIRISTRPDYIFEKQLSMLKKYNVATVEIGAESFVDDVLRYAGRGHCAADTEKAVMMLKKYGFKTGLHLMAGLPGDTAEGFDYSLDRTIELSPDTARIHPVLVFEGTALAEEFRKGAYRPLDIASAVELCRRAWEKLAAAGIRIIRMGVQTTPEMEKQATVLAGPVHPAFGSLVRSSVFYHSTVNVLKKISGDVQEIRFYLSERDLSIFRGLNNINTEAIKKLYPRAKLIIESQSDRPRGELSVAVNSGPLLHWTIPGFHQLVRGQ